MGLECTRDIIDHWRPDKRTDLPPAGDRHHAAERFGARGEQSALRPRVRRGLVVSGRACIFGARAREARADGRAERCVGGAARAGPPTCNALRIFRPARAASTRCERIQPRSERRDLLGGRQRDRVRTRAGFGREGHRTRGRCRARAAPSASTNARACSSSSVATCPGCGGAKSLPQRAVSNARSAQSHWGLGRGRSVRRAHRLGPVWTTVGAAFVEVRRLRTTPFTLALRGSFVDGQAVRRIDSKGSTRFTWAAGRVEVCPALVRLYAGFALAPCVGSHIARIKAVGSPTLAPTATGSQGRTVSKLWVDGVATLRLSFPVQPWLLLEAQGDLLFPLTRYDFGFDPGDRMFSVPALARAGLLGLVARFP